MSKRFIDTDMWRRPWYRALSLKEREAWLYILTTCDCVGVWIYDPAGAEFYIGESIDWDNLPSKLNDNIRIISDTKWWVWDFCNFQYGHLDPSSKANVIQSYINTLKRHNLWGWYQDGIRTPQEKEKEKDKEKEEEQEEEKEEFRAAQKQIVEKLWPNLKIMD